MRAGRRGSKRVGPGALGPGAEAASAVGPGAVGPDEEAMAAVAAAVEVVAAATAEVAAAEVADAAEAVVAEAAEAGTGAAHVAERDTGKAKGDEARKTTSSRLIVIGVIRPKRLRPPLRLVMWVAIVQIALVAVLMAVQKVRQPLVNSAVPDAAGGTFAVPLVVFIFMVISIGRRVLVRAGRGIAGPPGFGIPIAALVTWALADTPISSLRLGGTGHRSAPDRHRTALGTAWRPGFFLDLARLGDSSQVASTPRRSRLIPAGARWPAIESRIFLGALACVLAYYALEIVIWVLYARAGQAAAGTGSLLGGSGRSGVLLPTFLVLVVLLGSTDLLEWGEIAVQSFVVRAKRRRPPRLLMILTPLAAVAMIANVVRLDGINVLPELAVVGVPAVLIALLVCLAPGYGGWSGDIRSRAVITGAVAIFIYIMILPNITAAIRSAIGWSSQFDPRFYSLVSTPIALAALTAGLFLLAHGRIGKPEQRGRGLLLVIVGVLVTIAGLPAFLSAARLAGGAPAASVLAAARTVRLTVAALGTLGWLISLAVRKRPQPAAAQLANVLALLAGLQIVSWILCLLNVMARLGADSDYLLAGLFFLTVFWGFAMSGDNLTGKKANSAAYPRDGRILLTVSYTLVSAASLLYLGALRAPAHRQRPPELPDGRSVTPIGLAALGSALVIVAFVAKASRGTGKARPRRPRLRQRRLCQGRLPAGRARGVPRRPSRPRVPWRTYRAAQVAIAGIGMLATGAALVVLGSALPGLSGLTRRCSGNLTRHRFPDLAAMVRERCGQ